MRYGADREVIEMYAAERDEARAARDAMTEMERAHFDQEVHQA